MYRGLEMKSRAQSQVIGSVMELDFRCRKCQGRCCFYYICSWFLAKPQEKNHSKFLEFWWFLFSDLSTNSQISEDWPINQYMKGRAYTVTHYASLSRSSQSGRDPLETEAAVCGLPHFVEQKPTESCWKASIHTSGSYWGLFHVDIRAVASVFITRLI